MVSMLSVQILLSTLSGTTVMFFLVITLSFLLYKKKQKTESLTIALSSMLAMGVTNLLKYTLKVPRSADMLVVANDYRFPSGHATMAAVVMCLGIAYTKMHVHHKHARYFLYITAVAWFILVSYSRLYLHAHRLIDIIVGGLIGTVATIIILSTAKRSRSHKK